METNSEDDEIMNLNNVFKNGNFPSSKHLNKNREFQNSSHYDNNNFNNYSNKNLPSQNGQIYQHSNGNSKASFKKQNTQIHQQQFIDEPINYIPINQNNYQNEQNYKNGDYQNSYEHQNFNQNYQQNGNRGFQMYQGYQDNDYGDQNNSQYDQQENDNQVYQNYENNYQNEEVEEEGDLAGDFEDMRFGQKRLNQDYKQYDHKDFQIDDEYGQEHDLQQNQQFHNGSPQQDSDEELEIENEQKQEEDQKISRFDLYVNQLRKQLKKGEAIRNDQQSNVPADNIIKQQINVQKKFIDSLDTLIQKNIKILYQDQFDQVMKILKSAFTKNENNSFLLLGRSKQILQMFLNQVENEVQQKNELFQDNSDDDSDQSHKVVNNKSKSKKQVEQKVLKVVRVNSILNNSEQKIMMKFNESLDLNKKKENFNKLHLQNQLNTVEIINEIQEFFNQNKNLCVLFILEDIDYYIQTTKQIMLYKILDMLQYANIPFVFVATSQKVDIVDSFEKRIKSRFSHRQIFFYEDSFELFKSMLVSHYENDFKQIVFGNEDFDDCETSSLDKEHANYIKKTTYDNLKIWDYTLDYLELLYDSGKGYEYLCQQLKIFLSHIRNQLVKKINESDEKKLLLNQEIIWTEFQQFYKLMSQDSLDSIKLQNRQADDPCQIIKTLSKQNIIVLAAAKNVQKKASIFNFEAVYQNYRYQIQQNKFSQQYQGVEISKQLFLKLFLDLVGMGFLRSENTADILSVNNKVSIGFRESDFEQTIRENKARINLDENLFKWAQGN